MGILDLDPGDIVDDGDRAEWLSEWEQKILLAAHHTAPANPQTRDADGHIICSDCGEPIPADRLRATPCAVRCIDCQVEENRLQSALLRRCGEA